MRTISFVQRLSRDERGSAMVEFAIIAVIFFIPFIFGTIEFGRMAWAKNTVTAAAREGVRYAIVHGSAAGAAGGSIADSAAVANYVKGRTQLGGITVKTTWIPAKDPGDTVQVEVRYNYTSLIPIVPAKQLRGISRQIIAY